MEQLKTFYVDLHIHIGRSPIGKPVKITGAKNLTIENILYEASERKGLDMIGVIDSQVPEVLDQLERMVQAGEAIEFDEGGLRYQNVTLILGSEIELYEQNAKGPIHVLCYMKNLAAMKEFSEWLSKYMKNVHLSTQRFRGSAHLLQEKVKELGGIFIPAHVFTPFKSVYGSGVQCTMTEILDPVIIDAVELGLSSNTEMALQIPELAQYTFVTNSDAHSLGKMAREYQDIAMERPTFRELSYALHNQGGRHIIANVGLDPKLGKYHRTCCAACFHKLSHHEKGKPCPVCGGRRVIKGVYERLLELKASSPAGYHNVLERPPYIHQVPLEFIPTIGPKTLEKLLDHFGTEMAILHHVKEADLVHVVGEKTAHLIVQGRTGQLELEAGGAGRYGKVKS